MQSSPEKRLMLAVLSDVAALGIDTWRYRGFGPMPEPVAQLQRILTDEDKRRLRLAEEKRARRRAKHARG